MTPAPLPAKHWYFAPKNHLTDYFRHSRLKRRFLLLLLATKVKFLVLFAPKRTVFFAPF
jgi:hypothetical protein